MRKTLAILVLFFSVSGTGFAGSSGISLKAPQVVSWTVTLSDGSKTSAPASAINTLNASLSTLFSQLETDLNYDYFSKLHDYNQLSKGFANANAATFDNASISSFQACDLFALMVGFNAGAVIPPEEFSGLGLTFNRVLSEDPSLGLALGGIVAQLGVNTAFLVPNLSLSVKFGTVPVVRIPFSTGSGSGDVEFQQKMFGVGANYLLVPSHDLFWGFLKWRGVSVGSGLVYNSNSTKVAVAVKDYNSPATLVSVGIPGTADPSIVATVKNIKAKFVLDNSAVVIPLEVVTSLQALWFLNFGLGLGVDVAFPFSQIKVGAGADLLASGLTDATFTPGAATFLATDTQSMGDLFSPRIAASVGLNLTVLKLEVPFSYYPLTHAVAVGVSGGLVW